MAERTNRPAQKSRTASKTSSRVRLFLSLSVTVSRLTGEGEGTSLSPGRLGTDGTWGAVISWEREGDGVTGAVAFPRDGAWRAGRGGVATSPAAITAAGPEVSRHSSRERG